MGLPSGVFCCTLRPAQRRYFQGGEERDQAIRGGSLSHPMCNILRGEENCIPLQWRPIKVSAYLVLSRTPLNSLRAVRHEAEKNFNSDVLSPFKSCADHLRLASYITKTSTQAPTTRTSDDGMFITYKEDTLDIHKWRQALRSLLDKTKEAISAVCYGSDFGLRTPERVCDDWSNTKRGYSGFMKNTFLPHKLPLLDAILHDEQLQLASSPDGKSLSIDFYKVMKIMEKFEEINRMLSLLTFFLPGQPARGAEFIDYKICNSNRPRCVFLDEQGTIWIVVRRVKWENIAKREVFLPKKCPPELSNLLKMYLLIIRPVEIELSKRIYSTEPGGARSAAHNYSTFLWVKNGEKVASNELTKHIATFLEEECGLKGGVPSFRHISVEMSRIFFPPNYEDILEDNRARDAAKQRGHSYKMVLSGYALEADHLPELASDVLLNYGKISELWWRLADVIPGLEPLIPFRVQQEKERRQISELKKEVTELKADLANVNSNLERMSGIMEETMTSVQMVFQVVSQIRSKI